MPPSLAPAPFYGDSLVSLDSIRRIRFSRLFDVETSRKHLEEKKCRSKHSSAKSHSKGVKLVSNISHGVKKTKLKPKKPLRGISVLPVVKPKHIVNVRDRMRTKFDFSRTPYSLPARKPRVTLNEEISKKRKFFKTSVETTETIKVKNESEDTELEFEDLNSADEEPFAEIKKGVSKILHQIGWLDEEDCVKRQITRQAADESLNPISTPNKSYITLTNLSPSVEVASFSTPKVQIGNDLENSSPQNVYSESPTASECNSKISHSKKFFPLFTSPARNILSDVTNKNKKLRKPLDKAAAPNDQYQIDAGQRVIGPSECASCGMVFDVGDPFDIQRHERYHNNRKEIKYKSVKSENVVGYCGTDRIILIKHSEEKKRKKVLEVLKITEEEIGSGFAFESSFVAFLYVRNDSILGCLIAEPNVLASRIIHSDGIVLLSENKQTVKCGINRIWVKSEFRSRGIATELMNCLRKNFVFGEILETDDLAFSPTTPDGDVFAMKYCKRQDYLTYVGMNI